jgi:pimeloyl-ACP methyl ester carboxylesterase
MAAAAIAVLMFGMFEFQSQLIFQTHAVPRAGPLPPGAEPLELTTPDGAQLRGLHIPPDQAQRERTLVLGFGGNAWNGQDVAEYLHQAFPEADIVAFHYRGYAPSTGAPSAEALLADAPLVYDLAVGRVKPKLTIAAGFSIGSGIAARLAAERPVDGLILVTPFDSLKAVAQAMYPWLPIGPFFAHEIDAASALKCIDTPVAILSGARDDIVPAERTNALREQVSNLVFERAIARAGHNDIYARSEFQLAMREALDRLIL